MFLVPKTFIVLRWCRTWPINSSCHVAKKSLLPFSSPLLKCFDIHSSFWLLALVSNEIGRGWHGINLFPIQSLHKLFKVPHKFLCWICSTENICDFLTDCETQNEASSIYVLIYLYACLQYSHNSTNDSTIAKSLTTLPYLVFF